jgi:hypothetical protein
MDVINAIFDSLFVFFFGAFSWAPPVVGLSLLSAVVGVGVLWVFQKTSDQAALRAVKRKVFAYLLELRIYGDEPRATWRALKSLVAVNFRYLGLALRPALFMLLPMAFLLVHLEAFYGRAPLPAGQAAIVTIAVHAPFDPAGTVPDLVAPPGVVVETPPVRALDERQVSWRIRPQTGVSGNLYINMDGHQIKKVIEAGRIQRFVPGRRFSSGWANLWYPDERRIDSSAVDWIDIQYPAAWMNIFGIRVNWLIWFFIVSSASALALKKYFGVVL